MHRNGHNSTFGAIFNAKFEIPMGCFLFDYEFGDDFAKIYVRFEHKTGSFNAKFRNVGANGGEYKIS